MSPVETLSRILRPAGGGVHVVSTGVAEQQALQRRIYGEDIDGAWAAALSRVPEARVALLGVPSDNGAGFTRGANQAPAELRRRLLGSRHPLFAPDVVDVGDARVVPHLLADEMLNNGQLAACRAALYGDSSALLPASPLDQTSRALDCLFELNPGIRPVVVGGDHSVAWPAFLASWVHHEQRGGRRLGLLHFDAHTDLLPHRLGVRYCFATWAFHANELLGRDGRLVQVGVRSSGHDRAHWEARYGVRQYWAHECRDRSLADIAGEIAERFARLGVDALYVSNDIDGTGAEFAAATGTPEPDGLTPDFVSGLVTALRTRFPLVGGDLVEVAPPLAHERPGEPGRTLDIAGRYLADLIKE